MVSSNLSGGCVCVCVWAGLEYNILLLWTPVTGLLVSTRIGHYKSNHADEIHTHFTYANNTSHFRTRYTLSH